MPDQALWDTLISRQLANAEDLTGQKSSLSGINSVGDVRSQFGLGGNSEGVFKPLYRNLAASRSNALSRASARAGKSATAEGSMFAPVEEMFAQQEGVLRGQQGQMDYERENKVADMFLSILGGKDQYGMGKANALGNLWGSIGSQTTSKQNADTNWQAQNDPASAVDWVGALAGAASNASKFIVPTTGKGG